MSAAAGGRSLRPRQGARCFSLDQESNILRMLRALMQRGDEQWSMSLTREPAAPAGVSNNLRRGEG